MSQFAAYFSMIFSYIVYYPSKFLYLYLKTGFNWLKLFVAAVQLLFLSLQESPPGYRRLYARGHHHLPADQRGVLRGPGHAVTAGEWRRGCGKTLSSTWESCGSAGEDRGVHSKQNDKTVVDQICRLCTDPLIAAVLSTRFLNSMFTKTIFGVKISRDINETSTFTVTLTHFMCW